MPIKTYGGVNLLVRPTAGEYALHCEKQPPLALGASSLKALHDRLPVRIATEEEARQLLERAGLKSQT